MIKESEVFKIGKLGKPHGIKGEVSFIFDSDIFDKVECPYLICDVDGILVPFFVEEYRFKGAETALMTFEDIDSDEKALRLSGMNVYFPTKYKDQVAEDDEVNYSWKYFIGFAVMDKNYGMLGTIELVDDSTMNVVFVVRRDGQEHIIPATEDFMVKIDEDNKVLYLELMEGILDME